MQGNSTLSDWSIRPCPLRRGAEVGTASSGFDRKRTLGLAHVTAQSVTSCSPLRRKVVAFRCILQDRMTPRELTAFVGASVSVRRNQEKKESKALAIGTREDILMLDK